MTKTLAIVNYAETTTINLIDQNALCVFVGESGQRPLRTTGGLVTRTFTFKATATTKALARTAVNNFITVLRSALDNKADALFTYEYFLKEGADGETALRSLIVDWDAKAISSSSAIDAYQTDNIDLYVSVALTVQDWREETALTTATKGTETGPGAGGTKLTLTGLANTAPSSISTSFDSSLSGNVLTKLWVGLQPRSGTNWQHIWPFDYGFTDNDTTETTTAGSYGTNVMLTTFIDTAMERRVYMPVEPMYDSLGATNDYLHSKGRYYGLLRYKTTGTGTFLLRAGISYYYDETAYSEARLLDDSGNWRFAPIGVFQFPPHGIKTANDVGAAYENVTISIDAQRLAGSANLYYDYILWIPHDHFIALENAKLELPGVLSLETRSDLTTVGKTLFSGSTRGFCTISEQNNWYIPPVSIGTLQLVFAAERDGNQIATDDLNVLNFYVHEAFEAYNV